MQVESRTFFRGCTAGLSEKTALVDIAVAGRLDWDEVAESALRAAATDLYPAEPLYGVGESDWPTAFLVSETPFPDDSIGHLGRWVVALVVAVQRWGRDPVWRGRVVGAAGDRVRLAIPWRRPALFDEALTLALRLIPQWLSATAARAGQPAWRDWLAAGGGPGLEAHFGGRWPDIQANGLGPNSLRFIDAAVRRGMPFEVLPGYIQIGWGANAERFDLAATGRTSWIGSRMARHKHQTAQMLAAAGIPVPASLLVADAEQARRAADQLGWPVVVKPVDSDGGAGVTAGVGDPDRLARAYATARRISPAVLVERHCAGEDHRLLVVDGRVLQTVRRTAAHVVGDGTRSVRALLDALNADPRRGAQRYSLLKVLPMGDEVIDCLAQQGLRPDSVPPPGTLVWLARQANISAGGTADDVSTGVHPDNLALAVRAARLVGLDIAGVDFLSPDISRSWREVGGVICEVNGQPGFRPHWLAAPDRDINGEVLDIVFAGRPARIPTAAITGTNGKTTTCEMLHRIWTAAGALTGVCTTARLRIGEETVSTENLSGQPGAGIILTDPAVQSAVVEMPRKGLVYFGHYCDRYDVAALLNVQDDHIGADGVETLEQMAELKAEVLQRATGAVVLNAEDPLCLAMRSRAGAARHVLVARTPAAGAVVEHRRQGGEAVFLDGRGGRPWIVLAAGASETDLMPVHDVPATVNGLLPFNETNALFAAAVAWAQGVDAGVIRAALAGFRNSADDNPGRYNVVDGLPFDVLVDFAHNPDGVRGICAVAAGWPTTGRRVLCSLNVGSRHPGHLEELAPALATAFDEFVLGCDPELVGRCPEYAGADPAAAMVVRYRDLLIGAGVDAALIAGATDRPTAIRAALDAARPGDLLVVLADSDEVGRVVDQWRRRAVRNG